MTTQAPLPGTMERFIQLVEKMEATYSGWSAIRMANELRNLANNNGAFFQKFLGDDNAYDTLSRSQSNPIYTSSILELRRYLFHDETEAGVVLSPGIVKDGRGLDVATSHVIAGICAAVANTKPGGVPGLQKIPCITLAGDLGQTAAMKVGGLNPGSGILTGVGGEANSSELNGDIDGLLLGTYLSGTSTGQLIRTRMNASPSTSDSIKLSTFLRAYYSPQKGDKIILSIASGNRTAQQELNVGARYSRFSEVYYSEKSGNSLTPFRWNVIEQTVRFNYLYSTAQNINPLAPSTRYGGANVGDSIASVGIFEMWLGQKINQAPASSQYGTIRDESLYGASPADYISGGAGNDRILGYGGNDVLKGDAGNDYLDGGVGNDMLIGGIGNDTLIGGDGDDVLFGGIGNNILTGGLGQDYFVYEATNIDGLDEIKDFDVSKDKLVLIDATFVKFENFSDLKGSGVRVSRIDSPTDISSFRSPFLQVYTNGDFGSDQIILSKNWTPA
jgi:Ca2+-binding RTX toxin-like protein